MDPSVVGSANFGQIFKTFLPGNFNNIGAEQVFSQPLVYTGPDGVQYVYVATTQNNIYKLDAKTGVIKAKRNLHVPFLTADLDGCVDIQPTIGVTGTGVIDPTTNIWYLTTKTYSEEYQSGRFTPSAPPGRDHGRYYFHAIRTDTLDEVAGFPSPLEGTLFRNNPNRLFTGGIHHQRPGLLQVGDFVYAGFASHCVKWNFTGAVFGFNKNTGAIVEAFATEGGPEPNTIPGGGIWMSGGGLASDGKGSMYFATGNGYASQLKNTPVPGRQPPSALEEAAVNAKINDNGTLTVVDFFMPWEKVQLDGADKDLGTSPLELLPSNTFSCAKAKRIGVVTGKSGKTYWLNLDDLGGYQMGPNRLDAAIQVYQNENSVYAGAGVYPLEGGYIYINVIKFRSHVFKFSCDPSGNPAFTLVSNTAESNAQILGVGHGTTTSLNGQSGTGLYWVTDVEGLNLRIYRAVPPSNGGNLDLVKGFNVDGLTKFSRPVFGDGRVYLGTTLGYFYGFGSPVNLPLNCTSPVQFGKVAVNDMSSPSTITCKATTGTTVTGIALSGNPNFKLSEVPNTPLTLTSGQAFSFKASFSPKSVGPLSSDAIVNTTNAQADFSVNTPITLRGTANSVAPLLLVSPNTVSFNQIVGEQTGGVNQASIFSNQGDGGLSITSIKYSVVSETGPFIEPKQTNAGSQVGPFTFSNLPSTIPANSAHTISINYNPTKPGGDAVYLSVSSNGGTAILDVVAIGSTYPVALIEFENQDGSGTWIPLSRASNFTFGNVLESQTKRLNLRVTNNGTSSAAPLSITVSKPPFGVPGIIGAANSIDLAEGTTIAAGQSANATLFCSVPKSQVNVPNYVGAAQWTMNTGDPNLGKQFINFTCTAVAEQVGPLLSNGTAKYGYVGCFRENNPGRQLATSPYSDANNSNDRCITACASSGYIFSGTQYESECWCGDAIPIQKNNENDCNFQCSGIANETCGGNGYFHDSSQISLFADSTRFDGNVSSPPLHVVQSVGRYNFIGCYAEKGGKAVNAKDTNTNSMTIEYCASFCSTYEFFGTEYGSECFCGNSINAAVASLTDTSKCSMTCKGSNSEYCGAGNFMQMYQANGKAPTSVATSIQPSTTTASSDGPSPTATTTIDFVYQGCYNETHDRRALGDSGTTSSKLTLELCAAFCSPFTYFGVEYSSECYCANEIYSKSVKQPTESGCSMACSGDNTEICGGPDYLSVYRINNTKPSSTDSASTTGSRTTSSGPSTTTPTGPSTVPSSGLFKSLGCYSEINGRALTGPSVANSSMTVELCASFCSKYQYFGVEYSQECYCGDKLPPASEPLSNERCSMTCASDSTEYCGGPNALNVYTKDTGSGTTTGPPESSAATSTTSTTAGSTPTGPATVASVGNFQSRGCHNEVPGRALSGQSFSNSSNSVEFCAAFCASYEFFGVEYSSECYCGNSLPSTSELTDSGCSMVCAANASEYCGGPNRLNIYQKVVSKSSTTSASSTSVSTTSTRVNVESQAPTGPTVVPKAGSYVSIGCYTESPQGRVLPNAFYDDNMTIELCAAQAAARSYQYFGVEYGRECWMGNTIAAGADPAQQTKCSMTCPGNRAEFCGAGNFLQMYNRAATTDGRERPSSTSSKSSSTQETTSSTQKTTSNTRETSSATRDTPSTTQGTSSTSNSRPTTTTTRSSTTSTSSSLTLELTTSSSSNPGSSPTSFTSAASTMTPSTLSTTTSTKGSTTSTSASPTAVPTVSSYIYQGCFSEASTGRALTGLAYTNATAMSPALCAATCAQYAWFGVEYGKECYCGAYPRAGSTNVTQQADCNARCPGDASALCGAPNRLQMYRSNDDAKVSKDPAVVKNVGLYAYYSCVVDGGAGGRVLSTVLRSDAMSVEACVKTAKEGGYKWAGLEYGTECWLGNSLAKGATNASSEAQCGMACKGSPGEICGGSSRMTLYSA